jgi:hypothetical protein
VEQWSLWLPLVFAGVGYAVLNGVAGVTATRGNPEGAERLRDVAFLVALLATAWVAILVLIVLVDLPNKVGDMVTIMLVIVVFFAILGVAFFGVAEAFGKVRRRLSRRTRVTPREP